MSCFAGADRAEARAFGDKWFRGAGEAVKIWPAAAGGGKTRGLFGFHGDFHAEWQTGEREDDTCGRARRKRVRTEVGMIFD